MEFIMILLLLFHNCTKLITWDVWRFIHILYGYYQLFWSQRNISRMLEHSVIEKSNLALKYKLRSLACFRTCGKQQLICDLFCCLCRLFPLVTLNSGLASFYRSIKREQTTARSTLVVSGSFGTWLSLCRYFERCIRAVNGNAFANHNHLRAASVSVHVAGTRPSILLRWTCSYFLSAEGQGFPNSTLNCNICLILSWKLNVKSSVTAVGCNIHLSLNCLPCTLNAMPVRML